MKTILPPSSVVTVGEQHDALDKLGLVADHRRRLAQPVVHVLIGEAEPAPQDPRGQLQSDFPH